MNIELLLDNEEDIRLLALFDSKADIILSRGVSIRGRAMMMMMMMMMKDDDDDDDNDE